MVELLEEPAFLIPQRDQVDMALFDNHGRDLAARARGALGLSREGAPAGYEGQRVAWTQHAYEPYLRPPAYPHFLALVYVLGGSSHAAARIAQMTVGLASCVLGFFLGKRLFGALTGLLCAAFMATYWTLIVYEGVIHAPFLVIFFALVLVHALLFWSQKPGFGRAFGAGLALGLLALATPAIVIFVPVAAAWMMWIAYRRQFGNLFLAPIGLALGIAMMIAPVTVRNYRASGEFTLISTAGGITLLVGNHEGADATYKWPEKELGGPFTGNHEEHGRNLEKMLGRPLSWSAVSSYCVSLVFKFIREHPVTFLRLSCEKALIFWTPKEISHNVMEYCTRRFSRVLRLLPGDFKLVLSLAIAGLLLLLADLRRPRDNRDIPEQQRRRRVEGVLLVLLFAFTFYAPYTVFFVTALYRVPLIPFLLLFGAYGVYRCCQLLAARRFRRMAWALGGVAVYAVSCLVPVSYEKDINRWVYFRTQHYLYHGDAARALAAVERVLDSGESTPRTHLVYGNLLLQQGREKEAAPQYRLALEQDPECAEAAHGLGTIFHLQGKDSEALQAFNKALAIDPQYAPALKGIGVVLRSQGNLPGAITAYRKAVELSPDDSDAWYLLGLALQKQGDLDGALGAFQRGSETGEENIWPLIGMGQVLEAKDDLPAAVAAYQKALDIDPDNENARRGLADAKERLGIL